MAHRTHEAGAPHGEPMGKFDDLMVFVAVVERQSFIGAARQLGLSPAVVSRRIQDLEARLAVTLINRTTRRLSVTDVGREVYEHAAQGFAAMAEAERIATRRHETPSGVLRIVAPYTVTHLAIMPLLPQFRALYPDLRLEFIITNQAVDLIEYNCDIGVRIGAQSDSTYRTRPLFEAAYRVVASPAYLATVPRARRPTDLLSAPVAGLVQAQGALAGASAVPDHWTFVHGERREDVTFRFALAATEPILLVDFALQGEGFAIVTEAVVQRFIAAGDLAVVLGDWAIEDHITLSLIFRRHATMEPKTRVFLDFMRDNVRPMLNAMRTPA